MTPTEQETQLWIALNLAHRKIHREIEQALAARGLPPLKWYDVLWAVEMAGQKGVRASNLKDWILFEQSNLSRVLRTLIDKGLVSETVCDADRRAKTLSITDRGKKLRLKMWVVYGAHIHTNMQKFAASENADALLQALRQFGAAGELGQSGPDETA